MTGQVWLLLALWTLCECAGQVLFKRGMDALEAKEARFDAALLLRALRSPAIAAGVVVHAAEFLLWLQILALLPLSVAFPLESVSYVTVLAATRLFLREAIPLRRWMGVGLICAGIMVLGASS